MTFLELCQMTARQTGTLQGVVPTSTVGQINRLKQVVEFVQEAYIDIQNAHRMWRWMQGLFQGDTQIGTPYYAGTSFTDRVTGAPITRFSQWGFKGDGSDLGLSIYLTAAGATDEGPLRWQDWDRFYVTQMRGVIENGKPQVYSIAPDGRLIISPPPDDVYTLRGQFIKSPQILVNDSDVPEMPSQFHTVIKDAALCYVEAFDEGPRIPLYRLRMLPNFSMLELHELPQVKWGVPLA